MRTVPLSGLLALALAAPLAANAAPSMAQDAAGNPLLPVGVVACINVKDLQNYQSYIATAPAFAKDLLDRAACYISEAEQPAVKLSEQTGYTRYKLLSGHKVWVANGAAAAK